MLVPVQAAQQEERVPIDAEQLLWWAFEQTGYLPWRGVHPRELMADGGYTVIPKKCSRIYRGGSLLLKRGIDDDATIVIEAVKALDPAVATVVIVCAKQKIRPDWMEGVEPKRVPKNVYQRSGKRRRGKKKHRATTVMVWDIDPMTIAAARQLYERWHAAVTAVAAKVDHSLEGWLVTGFLAPTQPWQPNVAMAPHPTGCDE